MYCDKCGAQLSADAQYCGSCGKVVAPGAVQPARHPVAGERSFAPAGGKRVHALWTNVLARMALDGSANVVVRLRLARRTLLDGNLTRFFRRPAPSIGVGTV